MREKPLAGFPSLFHLSFFSLLLHFTHGLLQLLHHALTPPVRTPPLHFLNRHLPVETKTILFNMLIQFAAKYMFFCQVVVKYRVLFIHALWLKNKPKTSQQSITEKMHSLESAINLEIVKIHINIYL